LPSFKPNTGFYPATMIELSIKKEIKSINGSEVAVYLTDVSPLADAGFFNELYKLVSPTRREKTDRMRFEKDKRLSLGAEYLFMQACKDFDICYEKEIVVADDKGKLSFKNIPLQFNLSHSGNVAMCVMSTLRVGCDIEGGREADMKIARRFFAANEISVLENVADPENRARLFFDIWTKKESFIKCIGMGLYKGLDTFSVCDGNIVSQDYDEAEYKLFADRFGEYSYAFCVRC